MTNATKVPASVPNDVALRKDVTLAGCGRAAMGWRAAGTARDPAVAATTYKITVFFTTSAATVIGTGATRVRVPGHASAHWDVIARFHAPAGTLCVLRGVG